MKKFTLIFLLLMLIGIVTADVYTIGTGTSTQNYIPLYGLYDYSWSKVIYTATELTAAGFSPGDIEGIGFEVGNTPANHLSVDQRVYIRHTAMAEYTTTDNALPNNTEFQNVYNADYTWNGGGWHYIMFSSPFLWDGSSNLEIVWQNWDGDYVSGYPNFRYTTTTLYSGVYKYADNSFPGSLTGTRTQNRPNLRIVSPSTNPPNPATLIAPANGSTLTTLQVNLSWSPGNGGIPTGYKLYLGTSNPPAFLQDMGPVSSFTASSLPYGTSYFWQAVPYNAIGNASDCPVWSFTTMPDPSLIPPFTVGFGTVSGDWPVVNWTQRNGLYPTPTGTTAQWFRDEWLNGLAGNNAAKINIYDTTRNGWLITPPIAIPATGYELKFDLGLTRYGNANPVDPAAQLDDKFMVIISDSPNMSNPTILREWNNSGSEYVFNAISPTGEIVIIDLDAYAGSKFIAFYGESTVSGDDNDLFVDNVNVRQTPESPIISVVPNTWDFDTVLINTSTPKEFTITNTGAGSLNISSLSVTGTGFALAEAFSPVSLLSGQSANFTVNFAPRTEDTYSGNVVINDNRAVSNIPLNGAAIDATIYAADLPYLENFDTAPIPDFPFGWDKYISSSSTPTVDVRTLGTPNSAPNHVYMYNSGENTTGHLMLISPPIDVPLNTLRTKFYAKGGTGYALEIGTWDGSSFTMFQSILVPATYAQYSVNLSAYAGTDNRIAFRHGLGGTYRSIYIDDVIIEIPAPVAPSPATVAFPLNGSTTLINPMLKWTPSATGEPASSYKVYLNEGGAFTESHVVYTGTATEYQSTGLASGRSYFWKVLPLNVHGSDPACPTWSFSTSGMDQLAEGFEAATFPPAGWANGTTGNWNRSTATPLFEGSASAYKFTSTSAVYVLSTPMLTITANSSLDFYTRASATSQVLKMVYSTDRSTWTQIGADITYAATGIWYPISVNLSSLAGTNYYIGFQTPTHSSTGSIYVDHVIGPNLTPVLPGIPTLTAPADAAMNQSTYPILTWSAASTGGVPSGYNIYLDREADPSTLIGTSNTTSYSPNTPLDWNTTYYWKVAATNNAGSSVPSAVRSFTTMSDPTIYSLPFFEGFEQDNTHASTNVVGWTQEFVTGIKSWTINSTLDTYNRVPRTGSFNATLQWSASTWLFRPVVLNGGTSYDISLWARQDHVDTALANMSVAYGTAGNAAGMLNTIVAQTSLTNGDYQYLSGSFVPATSGVYYIGILGALPSSTNWYISLDDISLRESPTGAPDPVTLLSPDNEAVDLPVEGFPLTWTPALTGGTPAEYTVFMGPSMEEMYDNSFYNLTGTSFDPVADGAISFGYNETWYWTVMASNGEGDADVPEAFSFTTMQDPRILSLPYSQDFDGVPSSSMPVAWTGYVNSTSTSAYVRTSTSYAVSAPNSMYLTNSADTAADLRLITPGILVPMNSIKLSFSARGSSTGYTLLVGTVNALDGSGSFNQIASLDLTAVHSIYTVSLAGYAGTDQYICFKHALGGTYRSIYIDDIMMEELVPNDLALTAFSGDGYGLSGAELSFDINVYNNGTTVQNSYTVQMLSMPANEVLASIQITEPIAAGATATHTLLWTPANTGVYTVYAKVVLMGDVNSYNDNSEALTVGVFAANSYTPFIGNASSTLSSNSLPFNVYYKNSVAETIYMAHELQMASGTINAIVYHNTFTQDISIPVKIWMQNTSENLNSAWLPFANYTLVYDGTVFFPSGINPVVIPLQIPFAYTGGNLAVRNNRVMDTQYYSSSDKFFYTQDSTYPNRSRYYNNDSTVMDPANPALTATGTQSSYIPNTGFIVDPYTPISLDMPLLQISMSGTNPRLSWEAVEGAANYVVYGSNDPYNWDNATQTTTTNLYYNITSAPVMNFYKVTARTYNHQAREIGQVFNPASVIGSDHNSLKGMTKTIGTENKD